MVLITNLRARLPGKVGHILTAIDEVESAWEAQDKGQFPFNVLCGEIDALKGAIRSDYDDPETDVNQRSSAYDAVMRLEHRLYMSLEFMVSARIFESVERRFRRIDEVLPSRNYSLRDLLLELRSPRIDQAIKKRLEAALTRFDRGEYGYVLQECGQTGELLFALYRQCLGVYGCSEIPPETKPALERIRRWLVDGTNTDTQGFRFTPRNRVEWFLLSMFEALHFLRNLAAHPQEVGDERLPPWQVSRRQDTAESPDLARLALSLCFQTVLELDMLLRHQQGKT